MISPSTECGRAPHTAVANMSVFVEWASVGAGVLPAPHAIVRIAVLDDGTRQIDVGRQ